MATGALTEEIASNIEDVAEATRQINRLSTGSLVIGLGVGAAAGFYFGHRYSKQKIRAEVLAEAEEEISKIREFYQQKIVAMQAQDKPKVEEIIREKGYIPQEERHRSSERPLPPPVPVTERVFPAGDPEPEPIVVERDEKDPYHNWVYASEKARRSAAIPYIIHQDEFNNSDTGYAKVTYTYYAEDEVLVDEDKTPLSHADLIVGQNNLRFGHGTDDADLVYIRNDKLELEMEISRLPQSYEQVVLGLEQNDSE